MASKREDILVKIKFFLGPRFILSLVRAREA